MFVKVKNVYTQEVLTMPPPPKQYKWRISKYKTSYVLELRKIPRFGFSYTAEENPVRGTTEKDFQRVAQLILETFVEPVA